MGVTTKTLKEERERLIVRERMSKEEKKLIRKSMNIKSDKLNKHAHRKSFFFFYIYKNNKIGLVGDVTFTKVNK